MKRAIVLVASLISLGALGTYAVDLGPISLGLHLSPAVGVVDGHRTWDLSVSLGVVAEITSRDSMEILAIVDSRPTTLGLSVRYFYDITEPVELGGGLNILWAFSEDEMFVRTLIGSFAHAAVHGELFPQIWGELAGSLPLLTLAHVTGTWTLLPMTELPSLHLAGEWVLNQDAAWQGRITLQPVIADVLQFEDPIGRIGDNLLIIPMYSTFLRYIP